MLFHTNRATCRFMPSRQNGQISIEYLAVVTLVAIAVAGVSYFAYAGVNRAEVSNEVQAVESVLRNVRTLYAADADGFAGVTVATLLRNEAVPAQFVRTPALTPPTVVFPKMGTLTVEAATLYATNDAIALIFTNLEPDACSQAVIHLEGSFDEVRFGRYVVKEANSAVALYRERLGDICAAYVSPGIRTRFPLTLVATLN